MAPEVASFTPLPTRRSLPPVETPASGFADYFFGRPFPSIKIDLSALASLDSVTMGNSPPFRWRLTPPAQRSAAPSG